MLKVLPYNALRTLEAVVRLRGFGRAADEFNVTQSAVSQQIKSLEEWLGVKLLDRSRQVTVPTEAGLLLADAVRDGFGAVELVCDDLRGTRQRKVGLRLASPPGFAFLWLLPRLLEFDEAHPEIPVSISTEPASRDMWSSDADVFLLYGDGGFVDMHSELLLRETLAPVCIPEIARALTSVSDLKNYTILKDDLEAPGNMSTWDIWAREANLRLPRFPKTRSYGQANLVVQAAIAGMGVAMGRSPLVEEAIRTGQLVYPFPDRAPSPFYYWFVCHHADKDLPEVRAFSDWITDAAARASAQT